jgi:hypothetical protein
MEHRLAELCESDAVRIARAVFLWITEAGSSVEYRFRLFFKEKLVK